MIDCLAVMQLFLGGSVIGPQWTTHLSDHVKQFKSLIVLLVVFYGFKYDTWMLY